MRHILEKNEAFPLGNLRDATELLTFDNFSDFSSSNFHLFLFLYGSMQVHKSTLLHTM